MIEQGSVDEDIGRVWLSSCRRARIIVGEL